MSLTLRRAQVKDLAYVHRLEHDPANAPYINPWTRRQHLDALRDRDTLLLIAEVEGSRVGFVFLRGLKRADRIVEFKRIVIEGKGKGFGRAALRRLQEVAFGRFKARRLWLDVKGFNTRARALYRSEGFVEEGVLREVYRWKGKTHPHVIMGKLRREYRARD